MSCQQRAFPAKREALTCVRMHACAGARMHGETRGLNLDPCRVVGRFMAHMMPREWEMASTAQRVGCRHAGWDTGSDSRCRWALEPLTGCTTLRRYRHRLSAALAARPASAGRRPRAPACAACRQTLEDELGRGGADVELLHERLAHILHPSNLRLDAPALLPPRHRVAHQAVGLMDIH